MRKIASNGWIKTYRDLTEHWVFEDPEKLKIWLALLLNASHKKHTQNIGYELVKLEPGELIFGTISYSKELNIDQNKIYQTVKLFEKDGMINYDTSRYPGKFSIIKILNWEHYQKPSCPSEQEEEGNQQKGDKSTAKAGQKQSKTNNNGNNEKKGKNNIVPKDELEKIYNSLSDYWKELFKSYIEIYKSKNKTGKITDNRHYKLLKEINEIFEKMEFNFDSKTYQLTEKIFEYGLNIIIERGIDNLNYTKQVWIGQIEKEGGQNDRISKGSREISKESREKNSSKKKRTNYNKKIQYG